MLSWFQPAHWRARPSAWLWPVGLKHAPLVVFSSAATGALGYTLGGPGRRIIWRPWPGAEIAAPAGGQNARWISSCCPLSPSLSVGLVALPGLARACHAMMTGHGQVYQPGHQNYSPFRWAFVVSGGDGYGARQPPSPRRPLPFRWTFPAWRRARLRWAAARICWALPWPATGKTAWGGLISQGLGTSMLQVPNIVRKPVIWLPAIVVSAILGPLSDHVVRA